MANLIRRTEMRTSAPIFPSFNRLMLQVASAMAVPTNHGAAAARGAVGEQNRGGIP
jgi:hypothetical protein